MDFIRHGAHRVGQSIDIPTPLGRSTGGWVPLNLKLPQEQAIQLDQLREHPFFYGRWKTQAQVAWSMIYLGLHSVAKFVQDDHWDGWKKYKSNFLADQAAAAEWSKVKRQEALVHSVGLFRRTIHAYLDKNTAFGKYSAFKTLQRALDVREVVEDVREFDEAMLTPDRGVALGQACVFDNRAGELWRRCVPEPAGPIDEAAVNALMVEMTEPYYSELDAQRTQITEALDEF